MMPGVVAGFARATAVPVNVSLSSAASTVASGVTGFYKGLYGSITPQFANVFAGAANVSGARGELQSIEWASGAMYMTIVGPFSSIADVPFTSLSIDGAAAVPKSAMSFSGSETVELTWAQAVNPIPVGAHTLVFA